MAGNIPGADELAETVRLYAKALIRLHYHEEDRGRQAALPVAASDGPQLGDDPKAVAKAYRSGKKKKKERGTHQDPPPELKASWASEPPLSEQELAELAEQARLALEQAERLAGEPVSYLAGMIVPVRLVGEESPLRKERRYQIINNW